MGTEKPDVSSDDDMRDFWLQLQKSDQLMLQKAGQWGIALLERAEAAERALHQDCYLCDWVELNLHDRASTHRHINSHRKEWRAELATLRTKLEQVEREREWLGYENDRLLWVANGLTCDWPEGADLDGFDQQDLLLDAGLLENSVVTEADMEDEWPQQWDLKPGDKCLRLTALGEKARVASKPTREAE